MLQILSPLIVGPPDEFDLDARTLNGGCFVTTFSAGLSLALNHLLHASSVLDYPCWFGLILGSASWYLGRFQKQFVISLLMLVFSQIAALTIAFMYNGGAAGPTPYFYVTLLPIYIFILRPALAILISSLFFLNISILYFAQYKGYISPISHPSTHARIVDLYAALSLNFGLIVLIVSSAKLLLVNEQKKVAESNKAKAQFLANISHEIRTPMNAILGMNELALSHSTDEQQKEWLKTSQVAARHLLSLMEDVLDVSSIDQGKLIITPQIICLRDLVMGVIHILQPHALDKQLTLDLHLAENLPTHIQADPVRLRQILVNLINNAIKFTDKGSITISITRGYNTLNFSIRDTGLGIPAKEQEKIFDVFTQAENIDAIRHKGFGLGLAISKQLIEKMDGSLRLKSQQGVGSTFFFTLPLIVADEINSSSDVTPAILLVEDNEINVEVARIFLIKNNFTVDVAINGQKALDMLAKRKYAAVLMDLEMPVMDGFETTQALRAGLAGSLNQTTTVIALTAHALPEYREKSFKAGMNSFIAKPINGTLLVSEVQRIIAGHS